MSETRDNAGVIAPPPLLALAAVVIGLALDWLLPAYVLSVLLTMSDRIVIGALLIAAGLGLAVSALGLFRSAGTHAEPWKPSTTLVTEGIFKWLRNPMYVGLIFILAGVSILLASDWMLVMTIVFAPVIHFGVVKREERYLEAKFGEAYRQYKARVQRYGLPF
ncbi:MAG: isoprenylcysteine carboxylmethyltransferase family protein [Rhizobiales bacterium]|nr:isoprenylcysteine carboxylmethyltransferase family protein [Hyphomicrobiales bacterium]